MAEKVLIIDDSVSMRQLSSMMLKQAGYDVDLAADGDEALRKFTKDVAIILTDLNMPNMNGIEFIKAVRNGKVNKTVPIIIITTDSESGLKEEGRKAGATAWIVKPFDGATLVKTINKVSVGKKF